MRAPAPNAGQPGAAGGGGHDLAGAGSRAASGHGGAAEAGSRGRPPLRDEALHVAVIEVDRAAARSHDVERAV